MQTRIVHWGETDLIYLYGEGQQGPPGAQLGALIERCEDVLYKRDLSLESGVFHRLWAKDRKTRDGLNEVRAQLLTGARRTASSSFISTSHMTAEGTIALEMIAFRAKEPETRRLMDFIPARRYAHYMVQDNWLFSSGMAEEAATLDEQFDKALAKVEEALKRENKSWSCVVEASFFLERRHGSLRWLKDRFRGAVALQPPRLIFEEVDGLASPGKNLEIEVIAM